MINLVGNVFLAPDFDIRNSQNLVFFGEAGNRWSVFSEEEKNLTGLIFGNVVYSQDSYIDFVSSNSDGLSVFWSNLIKSEGQTIIYCDVENFIAVYSDWVFSMMPDIDQSRANFLFQMVLDRYEYRLLRSRTAAGNLTKDLAHKIDKFVQASRPKTIKKSNRGIFGDRFDYWHILPFENAYVDYISAKMPLPEGTKKQLTKDLQETQVLLLLDLRAELLSSYSFIDEMTKHAERYSENFLKFMMDGQVAVNRNNFLESHYDIKDIQRELSKVRQYLPNPLLDVAFEWLKLNFDISIDAILDLDLNSRIRNFIGQSKFGLTLNNYFIDFATTTFFKNPEELKFYHSARVNRAFGGNLG
tara:strand:+ start:43669 stop:44739 length:1071 start_codon:yes stop_codon:yes gene_type:complete